MAVFHADDLPFLDELGEGRDWNVNVVQRWIVVDLDREVGQVVRHVVVELNRVVDRRWVVEGHASEDALGTDVAGEAGFSSRFSAVHAGHTDEQRSTLVDRLDGCLR